MVFSRCHHLRPAPCPLRPAPCRTMRTSTSIKLAVAAVVALFFAGFVLRAATRLASAAMHSMLMLVVVVVVILWAVWKFR